MPSRPAVVMIVLVLGAVLADLMLNDGIAGVFLMRKFVDLVEYLSFWR